MASLLYGSFLGTRSRNGYGGMRKIGREETIEIAPNEQHNVVEGQRSPLGATKAQRAHACQAWRAPPPPHRARASISILPLGMDAALSQQLRLRAASRWRCGDAGEGGG